MILSLSYWTVIVAVAQVFLIGFVGYVLVKRGIIDHGGLNLLARLAISLFYPLLVFDQLTKNFSFEANPRWWIYPLMFFAIAAVGSILSVILIYFYKGFKFKKEFLALVMFQNCGYTPLLLVSALFTGGALSQMFTTIFLFCMGFDMTLWSFGIWLLAKHQIEKRQLKDLMSPPLAAVLVSLFFVWLHLGDKVPLVIGKPIEMLSRCALPIAMMVVGGNLALINIADTKKRDISLVLLVKLILLPAVALAVVLALKLDFLFGFLIVLQSAVPSAMTLSVAARHYKGEETFINQGIFFTHLFCMITLPFFLILYVHLAKGM